MSSTIPSKGHKPKPFPDMTITPMGPIGGGLPPDMTIRQIGAKADSSKKSGPVSSKLASSSGEKMESRAETIQLVAQAPLIFAKVVHTTRFASLNLKDNNGDTTREVEEIQRALTQELNSIYEKAFTDFLGDKRYIPFQMDNFHSLNLKTGAVRFLVENQAGEKELFTIQTTRRDFTREDGTCVLDRVEMLLKTSSCFAKHRSPILRASKEDIFGPGVGVQAHSPVFENPLQSAFLNRLSKEAGSLDMDAKRDKEKMRKFMNELFGAPIREEDASFFIDRIRNAERTRQMVQQRIAIEIEIASNHLQQSESSEEGFLQREKEQQLAVIHNLKAYHTKLTTSFDPAAFLIALAAMSCVNNTTNSTRQLHGKLLRLKENLIALITKEMPRKLSWANTLGLYNASVAAGFNPEQNPLQKEEMSYIEHALQAGVAAALGIAPIAYLEQDGLFKGRSNQDSIVQKILQFVCSPEPCSPRILFPKSMANRIGGFPLSEPLQDDEGRFARTESAIFGNAVIKPQVKF